MRHRRAYTTALRRIASIAALSGLTAVVVAGCATVRGLPFAGGETGAAYGSAPPASSPRTAAAEELPDAQRAVVETARSLVGRSRLQVNGRRFRYDCTGTILAAYYGAGIDLGAEFARYTGNGVTRLYRLARDAGVVYTGSRPEPGDVIFWDNTYDRNGDGTWNDDLTHAGIVVRTYEDGSLDYVHHNYRRGIVVARMNLALPNVHEAGGTLVNSPMRMKRDRHINSSQWLASHLYRSSGSLYEIDG